MESKDTTEANELKAMIVEREYYKNQFEAMRVALALEKERVAALEKELASFKSKPNPEQSDAAAPQNKKRRLEAIADDESQMSALLHHASMNNDQSVRRFDRLGRPMPVPGRTGIPKIRGRDKEPTFRESCIREEGKCHRGSCKFFHPDQEEKFGHMRDTLEEYQGNWKPKSTLVPE